MRIVDMHAHFYPRDYLTLLSRVIDGDMSAWGRAVERLQTTRHTVDPNMFDISAHIDRMDKMGLEMEVLSLSIPHVYFEDEADSVEGARIVNDVLADLCARYPGRFKGLAVLPFPHSDAAARELERAIDTLGLHGVIIGGNYKGRHLDDDQFLPVYREMNRRRLTVLCHPMIPPGMEEMFDYGLGAAVGYLADSVLGTLRLAFKGVFHENPDIKYIVPHLGTYLVSAWDRIGAPRPEAGGLKEPLGTILRRLYYDAVNLHRPTWDCALETIDVGHVVFGTDYPFTREGSTERGIALVNGLDISDEQREAIFHGTADRLLR